ncbi:TPA: hypothetical protein O4D25_003019 [Proteus mirabilis]|nr:hypothetical protein [Proteus mirabilis]MBI6438671.1 hypothetical protein [Proteus mirabilis]HBC6230802.1 hypothetical protein [Proteus mirabilis]HCZ8414084.1 hypothetical protein [Proteus mirabilis]HEJ9754736.1 hypothetical protein [Proteus mirabilis]
MLYFIYNNLYSGQWCRTLNIIDEEVRECLEIKVDTSLLAERITKVLGRLKMERGLAKQI